VESAPVQWGVLPIVPRDWLEILLVLVPWRGEVQRRQLILENLENRKPRELEFILNAKNTEKLSVCTLAFSLQPLAFVQIVADSPQTPGLPTGRISPLCRSKNLQPTS